MKIVKWMSKKNTGEEFIGALTYLGLKTNIHTKAINSKRQESEVVASTVGVRTASARMESVRLSTWS